MQLLSKKYEFGIILLIFVLFSGCDQSSDFREYRSKEDSVKSYYDNGNIKSMETMVNGKRSGECKYFNEKGSVIRLVHYKNGKKEGLCQQYFDNGQILLECYFKNDDLDSTYRAFNEDGSLMTEILYRNGVGVEQIYPGPAIAPHGNQHTKTKHL